MQLSHPSPTGNQAESPQQPPSSGSTPIHPGDWGKGALFWSWPGKPLLVVSGDLHLNNTDTIIVLKLPLIEAFEGTRDTS